MIRSLLIAAWLSQIAAPIARATDASRLLNVVKPVSRGAEDAALARQRLEKLKKELGLVDYLCLGAAEKTPDGKKSSVVPLIRSLIAGVSRCVDREGKAPGHDSFDKCLRDAGNDFHESIFVVGYPKRSDTSAIAIAETRERVSATLQNLSLPAPVPVRPPIPAAQTEATIGSELRPKTEEAFELVQHNQFEKAEPILDGILSALEKRLSENDTVYVCASDKAELDTYAKLHPEVKRLVWLDDSFADALHLKAYIAMARKQWAQ